MGRRKLKTTEDFERSLRNGYGIGDGERYKPWIGIRDVPSTGRSSLIAGITVNREHQTLSDLETRIFYGLDWNNDVVDIREQFPVLPRDVLMGIAKRYGITYPNIPRTKEPAILTTDFVATVQTSNGTSFVPIEGKYAADLIKKRELEKLEIKRLFWASLGYQQRIVTERNVDPIVAENLAFISAPLRGDLAKTFIVSDVTSLVESLPPRTYTIEALVETISVVEDADESIARQILFELIWYHCLIVDLRVSIQETNLVLVQSWDPVSFHRLTEQQHANSA